LPPFVAGVFLADAGDFLAGMEEMTFLLKKQDYHPIRPRRICSTKFQRNSSFNELSARGIVTPHRANAALLAKKIPHTPNAKPDDAPG
jgi:hypothetical protein